MHSTRLFAALATVCCLVAPATAWNGTGHRIIAAIAYEKLTPKVRARVDDLIRRHPDYEAVSIKDAPADPAARARAAFLTAANWPDMIRAGDLRFYDETRQYAVPTPLLPGFPDMARHAGWHFIDIPYTPDGAAGPAPPKPNLLTELERILREIKSPPSEQQIVYDLPWLEHLVGDVHQPLHCTSRFLRSQPKGDAGGNLVFVAPGRTLHSVWDDAAGTDTSDEYVTKYAARIMASPPSRLMSAYPEKWVDESFNLDITDVYTFGSETGSREHPIALPNGYLQNAATVSEQRIAVAGYRLAAVLNDLLR
jgi:S1/P1 Nuclease